jgi:spermidine synthase
MRILSIMQWNFFAQWIISTALLGFGASGALLASAKTPFLRNSARLVPFVLMATSISILGAYRISQADALQFDSFLLFTLNGHWLRLLAFVLIFFVPFFFASMAIGILYIQNSNKMGTLYFANLFGSGVGGLAGLLLLQYFLPQHAVLIIACFPALASLILLPHEKRSYIFLLYGIFLALCTWGVGSPHPPVPSEYKALSRTQLLPQVHTELIYSGAHSTIHIAESEFLRYAPGLSLQYTGPLPNPPLAFVNGNAAGYIPTQEDQIDILDYSLYKLPYVFSNPQTVAVISSGTGTFVAQALRHGATSVHAFESNGELLTALRQWHTQDYSVYRQKNVHLHQNEARSYLQSDTCLYDLIILPSMGSFGSTAGLDALQENFSMTQEALQTYWQRLSPQGSLVITIFNDFPPRAPLKIVYSFMDLLKHHNVTKYTQHIIAIRSWTAITFVLSKSEVRSSQANAVRAFCNQMGFDPFLLPDIQHAERVQHNIMAQSELFSLSDQILQGNTLNADQYPFHILPASDNSPYFSQFVQISRLKDLLKMLPVRELPYLELGSILVWVTLLPALLFSMLFILIPVLRFRTSKGKPTTLLFFGAIGLGYMFVEIIFIQRLVLYLGQSVYAVSAAVSTLLVASGIGSFVSEKIASRSKWHYIIFASIIALLLAYCVCLTPVLRATLSLSLSIKVLLACALATVPGFFMGMPFPLGLRSISAGDPQKLAWAFAINGFFSVMATPVALLVAVEAGAMAVLMIASLAYAGALCALILSDHSRP